MRILALALALALPACDTLSWRGAGAEVLETACRQPGACAEHCRDAAAGPPPHACP